MDIIVYNIDPYRPGQHDIITLPYGHKQQLHVETSSTRSTVDTLHLTHHSYFQIKSTANMSIIDRSSNEHSTLYVYPTENTTVFNVCVNLRNKTPGQKAISWFRSHIVIAAVVVPNNGSTTSDRQQNNNSITTKYTSDLYTLSRNNISAEFRIAAKRQSGANTARPIHHHHHFYITSSHGLMAFPLAFVEL